MKASSRVSHAMAGDGVRLLPMPRYREGRHGAYCGLATGVERARPALEKGHLGFPLSLMNG